MMPRHCATVDEILEYPASMTSCLPSRSSSFWEPYVVGLSMTLCNFT